VNIDCTVIEVVGWLNRMLRIWDFQGSFVMFCKSGAPGFSLLSV